MADPSERRDAIEKILEAWSRFPAKSLGQFLIEACEHVPWDTIVVPLYHQDDQSLVRHAERFANDRGSRDPGKG